ncbi:MAG: hypothetical protein HC831_12265 [Chloroflexia bacterium]|nr:hypothetical protein [Chloroflexia bacterium]
MHLKNPFSDYGGIVIGDRFIGRKTEVEAIQNRLLGINYGNMAIMGLPRIGKSSLSWNAIMEKRSELEKLNIIPIWISFGEYKSIIEVFQEVFNELIERISSNVGLLVDITGLYDRFIDAKVNWRREDILKRFSNL